MRDRVAFDENVGVSDGLGGETTDWQQRHECAAEFRHMRGSESVAAGREAGRSSFKVKIRASAASRAITTDYRMRDTRRGHEFEVIDVDAITDRAWVWLVVSR